MKKTALSGILVLLFTVTVWGADVSQTLKTAASQAQGSLCVVDFKLTIADEETPRRGIGICIDTSSGMMMTMAIPTQAAFDEIKDITLTPPGKDAKPFPARLQGIDTVTGLSFIRCEGKHPFTAVEFLTNAGVSMGDLVISAGLDLASPESPLTLGMGYISSIRRIPNHIYRTTGGKLSVTGSVVLNAEGKAIGLVTTQPYLPFQVYRRQRAQTLLLRNLEQAVSFTPVEEFAQILANIPSQGVVRRPNWIGGILVAVPENLREAKGLTEPAVMFDQILPGTSADKAGLKNRDIVVGVNGAPISSMGSGEMTATTLRQMFARMKTGDRVALTVQSDAGPREVSVQIEPMPTRPSEAPRLYQKELGFVLREKVPFDLAVNDVNAQQPGLIVLGVVQGSPSGEGKLQKGDLVIAIDGKSATKVDAAEKALRDCLNHEPPRDVTITVLRGSTPETLTIKVPAKE
jgi:serine protease Do